MFVRGHTVLFLCLCDLGSKGTPQRLLRITAFLRGLEEHGIPPHKRYFIMFVQEHAMGFLYLFDLVSKTRHKAATHNGVPLGIGRARYTPHKRYFIMFVRGHTVLFLCLCNLGSKGALQRLLLVMVFL